MSIWVRSQDKEILVEASNFRIFEGLDKGKVSYYTVDIDSDLPQHPFTFELGKYSTKEKAIKVLDMIQGLILYTYYGGTEPKKLFQMPQDDEVEVWNVLLQLG